MSDELPANSTLYRFLDSARVRMEFRNIISAAGIAATAVCAVVAPFVAWRATIKLHDGMLIIAIGLGWSALFVLLAMKRNVRLQQVPQRLEINIDEQERVATATEFMGDDDPFKRLAVRQTEAWIEHERERLSEMTMQRLPFVGAGAILLLILLWLLTPGVLASSLTGPTVVASHTVNRSRDLSESTIESALSTGSADGKSSGAVMHVLPGNTAAGANASHASMSGSVSPRKGNAEAIASSSAENSNLPGTQNGQSPNGSGANTTSNAHPGVSGQTHGQVSAVLSGGVGRGSMQQVHTRAPPSGATVAIHATGARADNSGKEQSVVGLSENDPAPRHAASASDVKFTSTLDSSELEELPSGRRQLVVEYFRSMHDPSNLAPATQSSQGDDQP